MRMFDKVAIVGTGLIGGSIALALKKKKICRQIIGVSLHRKSLIEAKRKHAVDIASLSLDAIKDADLVILATPVSAILSLAPGISGLIRKDCIVFDVGSTKARIVRELSGLFPLFVGTHPLAGSEKRGVTNAQPDLFRGSLCIITPAKVTSSSAVDKIREFWGRLGAKTVIMSPAQHDLVLGFVSHLPHVLAFSLISSIPVEFLKFSPASLRDASRVAVSDSRLWSDIFLDNKENLLKVISEFQRKLEAIKSAIKKNNPADLSRIIRKAKERREALK